MVRRLVKKKDMAFGKQDPCQDKPRALAPAMMQKAAEREDVRWKLVISTPEDFIEAHSLVKRHGINPDAVWLMPEGRTVEEIMSKAPDIADRAIAHGFNFTLRLQVALWGSRRGV